MLGTVQGVGDVENIIVLLEMLLQPGLLDTVISQRTGGKRQSCDPGTRHRATGFKICPAGFELCSDAVPP